jgi:hypothetical protein
VQATRTGGVDQLDTLARLTGLHGAFAPFMNFQGGNTGWRCYRDTPSTGPSRLSFRRASVNQDRHSQSRSKCPILVQ